MNKVYNLISLLAIAAVVMSVVTITLVDQQKEERMLAAGAAVFNTAEYKRVVLTPTADTLTARMITLNDTQYVLLPYKSNNAVHVIPERDSCHGQ